MSRAQCKDEAHDGDTAWVDREDCLLVQRSVGGAYNRAARMQDSLICVACASRIVASIEAQGGPRGHRLHNRWSISSLQNAYARFRRSRGLAEAMNPTRSDEEVARLKGLAQRAQDDSEGVRTQGTMPDGSPRLTSYAMGEALTQEEYFGADLALEPGGDPSPRSYDEMPVAHLTPKEGSLKPVSRRYVDIPGVGGWTEFDPPLEFPAVDRTEQMQCEIPDCPATAILGNHQAHPHHEAQVIDNGADSYSVHWWESKTDPDANVPLETAEEQAALYAWASEQAGIELTEAQKEQAKARIQRGPLPEGYRTVPLQGGKSTAADLLREIRERQGRSLHEATHLHAVPPLPEGVKAQVKRMQVSYPFLQTDPIPGRVRMQDVADRETALAYGGLVPRKRGEFHHHFDRTPEGPLSPCVHCGKRLYDDSGPCPGPRAEEWEARMQERRDLKERVFHLAYGVSTEGNREAARKIREFDTETLRLFPERFREPTAEELKHREEFQDMLSRLTQGQFTPGGLTEAEERYLAKARRQQDELNEQIRAAKEAAWDEGREAEAEAHFADGGYGNVQHPENPYRKADDE